MISGVKYDAKQVDAALRKLKTQIGTKSIMRMNSLIGEAVRRNVVQNHLSGRPGLNRVTGNLAKSISWQLEARNQVSIGSNLAYASIHEFGGEIKAKNVKYLRFRTADGSWHSRKSVTIPMRPYLKPGILETFESGEVIMLAQKVLNEDIMAVWR